MIRKQTSATLNAAARQYYGQDAVQSLDLTNLFSLGTKVLSSNTDKEGFLGVLVDRIGKTVLRTLNLSIKHPFMLADSFTFGAVLQKITIEPFQAKDASYAKVGQPGFRPTNFDIDKPTVTQKLFQDSNAWQFDVTIPDTLWTEAFTSEASMAAFIDGIMSALQDSLINSINNMSELAITNFIGEKLHASNAVVHVLTLYNQVSGKSATADDVEYDKDFYKFFGKLMRDYMSYMSRPSVLFNVGAHVRQTPKDQMHIILNSRIASGYSTYLESDTFHKELVALPGYTESEAWQGTGTWAPTLATTTAIDITTSSGNAVQQGYIIGLIADRNAIMTGYKDAFTATDRNNRDRYTNYTSGHTEQYINDLDENGIIFVLD